VKKAIQVSDCLEDLALQVYLVYLGGREELLTAAAWKLYSSKAIRSVLREIRAIYIRFECLKVTSLKHGLKNISFECCTHSLSHFTMKLLSTDSNCDVIFQT